MDSAEVVMDSIQGDGITKVINLLAESVCQPGKSTHGHPHRQVSPFNVASGDVLGIRLSRDCGSFRSEANRLGYT